MHGIFQHCTVSHSYSYIDSHQGVAKGNHILLFATVQLHWNKWGLLIGTSIIAVVGGTAHLHLTQIFLPALKFQT